MIDDNYGNKAAMMSGASLLLINFLLESGEDTFHCKFDDCTIHGEDVGGWIVTIERVREVDLRYFGKTYRTKS